MGRGGSPHGGALAVLARTGHVAAIQVLEATVLDNGATVPLGQRRNPRRFVSVDQLRRLRSGRGTGIGAASQITLFLDLRKAAHAIGPAGTVSPAQPPVLRQQIAVLEAALRAAELHRSIVKLPYATYRRRR